jgi:hypothetical protein
MPVGGGKLGAVEATPNMEAKTLAAISLVSDELISPRGRLGTRTFSTRGGPAYEAEYGCDDVSGADCGSPDDRNHSGCAFISMIEETGKRPSGPDEKDPWLAGCCGDHG